ncbi:MAG TPA: tetratricopeptide repeat protein [Myxococcales bacterium]|nr:tetratricopeptide repeat protein [Myxococcales bacterium]
MMLLLALLVSAPDPVGDTLAARRAQGVPIYMLAKKAGKPGLAARASQGLSRAFHRLYEKDDPDVDAGNALSARSDAEGALKAYDRALERLPESPELRFDRASALLKLPAESAPEAAREAAYALEHGGAPLKPGAAFDLGLANEAMGKPDQAIQAYQQALALDPADEDSKVNLELLLRSNEERKQRQQMGKPQEDKQKQEGKDQQKQQSQGGEQKPDSRKQSAGEQEKQKQPSQEQPGQQQAPRPDEKKQAQASEKPVDRSEAERLLDALRADEKNLQPWRFAREKTKERQRRDAEKDW